MNGSMWRDTGQDSVGLSTGDWGNSIEENPRVTITTSQTHPKKV